MDTFSKRKRSEIMARVKSRDSKLEVGFRKALWRLGFRYRKNSGKYEGKPDIALLKHKAVVFVDSCFWHGCAAHCRMPAANRAYWEAKIAKNAARDAAVSGHYAKSGWRIFRVWEHEIKVKKDLAAYAERLAVEIRFGNERG